MKNPTTLKLTRRNTAAITECADLAGLMPEQFLNTFLKDFLVDPFEDLANGVAEQYLGHFRFSEYATAKRVAEWMQDRFNRKDPHPETRLEAEVIESPKRKFQVSAAFFSHGQMYQISPRS